MDWHIHHSNNASDQNRLHERFLGLMRQSAGSLVQFLPWVHTGVCQPVKRKKERRMSMRQGWLPTSMSSSPSSSFSWLDFWDNEKRNDCALSSTTMTVYFLASSRVALSMYRTLSLFILVRNGSREGEKKEPERKSRKHTIMSLAGFITIIVRLANNNMEMITWNRTYVKKTRKTGRQASELVRKCNCLPRIRT